MTTLGFGIRMDAPEPTVRSLARAAEVAGYSTLWMNNPPGQDSFPALTWAVQATSRIPLGTGVIPISHHPPAWILENLAQLGLPESRYRLGIGSGPGGNPVARVHEALTKLRQRGSYELVVGALGPRMCALGGREADAILLNAVLPTHARESAAIASETAEMASRPRPKIYAYLLAGLGQDAIKQLDQAAAFYAQLPAYAAHFKPFRGGPFGDDDRCP